MSLFILINQNLWFTYIKTSRSNTKLDSFLVDFINAREKSISIYNLCFYVWVIFSLIKESKYLQENFDIWTKKKVNISSD